MHVCAVQLTPPPHEPEFVHDALQLVFPHDTSPAHAPAPVQQIALVVAALETLPVHDGEPEQISVHCVVALHVTLPLHAWSPHVTLQFDPEHVMSPRHAVVSHAMVHCDAVHVTSFWHELYAHFTSQLEPPHWMLPRHALPPPSEQSMVHAVDLLQSMSPHALKPQSISHGTPAGHTVGPEHALFEVQSKTHTPCWLHDAPGPLQTLAQLTCTTSGSVAPSASVGPASNDASGSVVTSVVETSGSGTAPSLAASPSSSRLHADVARTTASAPSRIRPV